MPGGDFFARPSEGTEVCQIKGENCDIAPSVRIYCKTEGRGVLACASCHAEWRRKITESPAETFRLELRCPLCANWRAFRKEPLNPVVLITPTGSSAAAIDAAMHAEGLLVDIRNKVLSRIQRDAPWLFAYEPDPLTGTHRVVLK